MKDSWDDYAEGWDTNPDAIRYSQMAFDSLLGVADIEGAEVFDLGCGTGLLSEKIASQAKSIVALDTSPKMMAVLQAKNLPNVTPVFCSLPSLLNKNNSEYQSRFDLVVASSVCAFVPDYGEVLEQIKTILKPGGQLIQWDWYSPDASSHPGFTEDQISGAIIHAGFSSVSVSHGFAMSGPDGDATVLLAVARK